MSSRWLQSRNLDTLQGTPSSMSVYRDPYHSLKQILRLVQGSPGLGACVHRLWFNGYNSAETVGMIFEILQHCPNLDHLTIPWTALRYGTKEDWSHVLGRGAKECKPLSLEFLAVDLSIKKMSDPRNQHDELPLDFATVDFTKVERLKVFGNTNFMPITNKDLIAIARSARNLKEIHITGTSSVTIDGVMALVEASHSKLRLLEHSPLSKDGFEHPDPTPANNQGHLCQTLLTCHQLRDLSISLPSFCEDLFRDTSVHWQGEVQIRAGSLCSHHHPKSEPETQTHTQARFWRILDLTRSLMAVNQDCEGGADAELDIQLFINYWIFEPRRALVHGNIEVGQALSDGLWPRDCSVSCKGPYGQTGLYGKDEGPYSCVSEEEFAEGLRRGYVSF